MTDTSYQNHKPLSISWVVEKSNTAGPFKTRTAAIDSAVSKILNTFTDKKFQEIINYQTSTGGKKLRPILAIISCKLFNGSLQDVLYPAAGLEIMHNYSLIVDDIIDISRLRRHKKTTWAKYGKSTAQCIAINHSASVFQAANHSKYPDKIMDIFAKTTKESVNGEIMDLLLDQKNKKNEFYLNKNKRRLTTRNQYLKMASKKTAALISACCEAGAVCAQAKNSQQKAIKTYGFNLGIAFQIRDDILDIFGDEKKLGKKIGQDIKAGKLSNIVIILALQELSKQKKEKLLSILRHKNPSQGRIKQAIQLINQTKAKQKALGLAKEYSAAAKRQLSFLPQNIYSQALSALAGFTTSRDN